ncbi:hypothetical protein Cabys_1364 [Caldithrix abyssi DSM 13497]|uniref:Uncharacterized protein n=1 Tax=Caldithrix abyssi DSM 13497 TaxID=880073 RepID=A0A1J1C745_CALAY|nr:hypothetical protein Cabys_1364 [Caldithrix abyssi DSM 13497]
MNVKTHADYLLSKKLSASLIQGRGLKIELNACPLKNIYCNLINSYFYYKF